METNHKGDEHNDHKNKYLKCKDLCLDHTSASIAIGAIRDTRNGSSSGSSDSSSSSSGGNAGSSHSSGSFSARALQLVLTLGLLNFLFSWYTSVPVFENSPQNIRHTPNTLATAKPFVPAMPRVYQSATGFCPRVWTHSNPRIPQNKVARCKLTSCFNFTKCSAENFTIYVYPTVGTAPPVKDLPYHSNDTLSMKLPRWAERDLFIHHEYMAALRASKYYVEDPDKACLFFPDLEKFAVNEPTFMYWGGNPEPLKRFVYQLPHWNDGINHILWDHTDFDYSWWGRMGYAMFSRSSWSTTYYRDTFDVAFPSPNAFLFSPSARANKSRALVSYFVGNIKWQDTRQRLFKQGDDTHQYKLRPGRNHDSYAEGLLSTNFGVCPRGVGLATRRTLETLAAGAVPVVLADGWVLPFSDTVNWTAIALRVPERDTETVNSYLDEFLDKHRQQYDELKQKGFEVFNRHFLSVEQWIDTMLESYREKIRLHECTQYQAYLDSKARDVHSK